MTYKEAIDLMKFEETQVCISECSSHRGCCTECDCCGHIEMMDKAIESLEKAEKYRYHDLRKTPDDLPTDNYKVAICLKGFEGRKAGVNLAMHSKNEQLWVADDGLFYKDCQVIAWKEIEPFCE